MKSLLIIVLLSFSIGSVANKGPIIHRKKKKDKFTEKVEKLNKFKQLTDSASCDPGLFSVYKKKGDYYFLLPDSLTARDFLIVNKISQVPANFNDAGINKGMTFENFVIQFEINKEQKKVYALQYKPFVAVSKGSKISESVANNFAKSILESFSIEAYNNDSTAVIIKVNKVYDGTKTSFNNVFGLTSLGTSPISDYSYISSMKSFPQNIVVKSMQTTKIPGANTEANLTLEITSNLVLLPKTPMIPRFEDSRVGYFTTPRWYFNDEQHQLEKRELVTRWRLEPKDKKAYLKGELTEPIKPIVFYIDPATPPQWRKYIIQGVNDWQKAFEKAGFKNAIIAKEVSAKDSDFDIDDVRYSVVTYVASDRANAMGPSVYDPRSGEILESDVIWWHNVMTSVHSWMRVQTGIIDEKSRANKFSDEHMGEAIRFVSSHEIGHTLGLKHNMGASYAYPVDSLRSETFCRKMATAPSIMDYARFNYIAQPEDSVKSITPKIGEYDKFAINWAYRYYPEENAHKELSYLKELVAKAYKNPDCHYLPQQDMRTAIDPRAQSEDLGDDAVKASEYGIKNLKRIMPNILKWTTSTGDDYLEAGKLANNIIGQWYLYAYHVLTNVGGIYLNNTIYGDQTKSYIFVPRKIQKRAVQYLVDQVITYPKWLFGDKLFNYVYPIKNSPNGYREQNPFVNYNNIISYVLWDLLTNERIDRMIANEAQNGQQAYTAAEFMDDLYKAIFAKTIQNKPLSIMEMSVQKEFIDALIIAADKNEASKEKKKLDNHLKNFNSKVLFSGPKRMSEAISIKRGGLLRIEKLLKTKINQATLSNRYHYEDMLLRINQSLR
ncbi:zinc-dependent metalloprotease [uncultured Bacteroides sp.]|uniref:zinc-dependent metalloprotease n=1 Tax=uncultured Bacteroides sp. TaxID=162156 RepID=UPI002AAB99A1|nr:zinc-dependent metalloprotease [uncultured Bacteroides sp.]